MGALANLQNATARLNTLAGQVVTALNAPKGVPEADVQLQADNVNAANDQINGALNPPAAAPVVAPVV